MSRVSIGKKAARELVERMREEWPESWALMELERALEHERKPRPRKKTPLESSPRADMPPYVALKEWAYPKMVGDREKALRKESRREETAAIREACLQRANGVCECGCGRAVIADPAFANLDNKAELEHPFSKGKGARLPQSVETCWILRADCHRERTNNRPDAATWWRKFIAHCIKRFEERFEESVAAGTAADTNYSGVALGEARKRLAFVEVRAALPSSPRTRHD